MLSECNIMTTSRGRHQHAYLGQLSCWALAAGGFGLLAGRKGRFLLICIVEKQYKTKVVTIDKDMNFSSSMPDQLNIYTLYGAQLSHSLPSI